MSATTIHLELDAPTSLHGNGAASFALTTRDPAAVSCTLCLYLWHRNPMADATDREIRPLMPDRDEGKASGA